MLITYVNCFFLFRYFSNIVSMRFMIKFRYIPLLIPAFIVSTALAQQNPSTQIYRTYHSAIDLMDKGKYVAAAEQFRIVEASRLKTSTQPQFESELSLFEPEMPLFEPETSLFEPETPLFEIRRYRH